MSDNVEVEESFRDTLSTVDEHGKRVWLFPKKPSGSLYNARGIVSIVLLAFMIFIPFIKINGHPLFLLNVMERKFILFGQIFWPQDFHLIVIGFIAFLLFIILFTVIFGRVWCGWACPQTIFMEMIFRKIEYWVEGTAVQQKKLYEAPWNSEKIKKRMLKHFLFLVVSFLIAHIVLAWIVGVNEVAKNFTTNPLNELRRFLSMVGLTLLIYGVYIRFREQMCTTFCPYGRLQGVILGNDSMVVGYDYKRGEPRGKVKNKETQQLGDCVDCGLCVRVCPTGIDIRNGTQLECVNCTACIDACDEIMEKVGREKNLIGYHSIESIETGKKFKLSARQKAYSILLTLIVMLLTALLFLRTDIESTVLRSPGTLYYKNDDGTISNLYKLQVVNKTFKDVSFKLTTNFENAEIKMVESNRNIIPASEEISTMFFLHLPKEEINKLSTKIKIIIKDDLGNIIDKEKTTFLGPITNTISK